MIVTTKSGAALDKPIINFRVEGSMSTPTNIPEFVDGVTFMELYNEAIRNQPAGKEAYTQERIDGTRQGLNPYIFPDVDWYGAVSYTHLDVYKRQLHLFKYPWTAEAGTAYHNSVHSITVETLLAALRRCHIPVSYTHLDVYKRQFTICR